MKFPKTLIAVALSITIWKACSYDPRDFDLTYNQCIVIGYISYSVAQWRDEKKPQSYAIPRTADFLDGLFNSRADHRRHLAAARLVVSDIYTEFSDLSPAEMREWQFNNCQDLKPTKETK